MTGNPSELLRPGPRDKDGNKVIPNPKGSKKGPKNPNRGRPPGSRNTISSDIRLRAKDFLERPKYQSQLSKRIMEGRAERIEVLLYYYAYGKPKINVEITAPPGIMFARILQAMTRSEREIFMAAFQRSTGASAPIDVTPERKALSD